MRTRVEALDHIKIAVLRLANNTADTFVLSGVYGDHFADKQVKRRVFGDINVGASVIVVVRHEQPPTISVPFHDIAQKIVEPHHHHGDGFPGSLIEDRPKERQRNDVHVFHRAVDRMLAK